MQSRNDLSAAQDYLRQGNYKKALKAALAAARKSAKNPQPFNIAGLSASALGKPKEAAGYFQKALKLAPESVDLRQNLAQTLILAGRADQARALLSKLTGDHPGDWKGWYLKAQAELSLRRERDALVSVDQAIALGAKHATLYRLRHQINLSLGRTRDAIADLEAVLESDPNDVQALTQLSLPLARQLRTDEALGVVSRAVAIAPHDLAARYRLGLQLSEMGDHSRAASQFRAILDHDPGHAGALEQLAHILPNAEAAELAPRIRTALDAMGKPSEERAALMFALSSSFEKAGDAAQADRMLTLANKDMARLFPYDAREDAAVTQAILDRFPLSPPIKELPATDPAPIFVLGLPRSGTTLVEAMLGMHSAVAPLGEQGFAGFILRDMIETDEPFDQEMAQMLHDEQRVMLPDLPLGARAYVDKMPENYRLVGFLKAAFPNARIISLRRDPRDIGLSMWRAHFSSSALSYAYDWKAMAAKFNLFAGSMARWSNLLGDDLLEVRYEDLVASPDDVGQKLTAFCGLDWQPQMARPEESTSQILTLSATQLRQPVHAGSVGKWKSAPDQCGALVSGLDVALWGDYLSGP